MAKLKAPLLSLGASGKIAGTLVFFVWKGLKVAREYVIPANPKTAAQVTQRGYFADAVLSWRTYFTDTDMRQAWNRAATAEGRAESGFNNAMRGMVQMGASDDDASFASTSAATSTDLVTFTMLNMDDGATGDEIGDFAVWKGSSPDSLLYFENKAIAAGDIVTSDLGETDDIVYVQLVKDSQSRSGVVKHTLIA